MHLWILSIFVGTTAYGISRISELDFKAVNFAEAIIGQKLNGSLIRPEIEVDSEGICRLECVEEETCQPYNYGTKMNQNGKFFCQLSNSDRFVGLVNLTRDDDFKYRGLRVMLHVYNAPL